MSGFLIWSLKWQLEKFTCTVLDIKKLWWRVPWLINGLSVEGIGSFRNWFSILGQQLNLASIFCLDLVSMVEAD
jgi:hypothetical protein